MSSLLLLLFGHGVIEVLRLVEQATEVSMVEPTSGTIRELVGAGLRDRIVAHHIVRRRQKVLLLVQESSDC